MILLTHFLLVYLLYSFPEPQIYFNTTSRGVYLRDEYSTPSFLSPPDRYIFLQQWLILLEVGDVGSLFNVVLDTGSHSLQLFNQSLCDTWASSPDPTLFNPVAFHNNCFNETGTSILFGPSSYSLSIDGGIQIALPSVTKYKDKAKFYGNTSLILSAISSLGVSSALSYETWNSRLYWNETDGQLGMQYYIGNGTAPHSALTDLFITLPPNERLLGIYVNRSLITNETQPSYTGSVHAGGIMPFPDFSFGEPLVRHIMPQFLYQDLAKPFLFSIYQFKLCDTQLLGNYTFRAIGTLDWGTSCLGLPSEIFDSLVTWIPVNCFDQPWVSSPENLSALKRRGNVVRTRCYLKPGVDPESLPTLSFTLNMYQNPSETTTYKPNTYTIPLSRLVFDDSWSGASGSLRLCIERRSFYSKTTNIIIEEEVNFKKRPLITFGSMILQSLYTVVNMQDSSVGFANLEGKNPISNSLCSVPVTCKGEELYYRNANICQDPVCLRWFYSLDSETKYCVLSSGFKYFAIFCCIFLGAVEIFLIRYQISTSRKAMQYIPVNWLATSNSQISGFLSQVFDKKTR